MPGAKYEQLLLKADNEDEVFTNKPKRKWSDICFQKSILSLGLILLYFSLSIGLTFYQRWLLKEFHYPLTVVMYHLIVKWILSVVVRFVLYLITGTPQLLLTFITCLRSVGPTGLASGIDVGFSNWGLELVTISLYTMTKSTTIIFILGFAIILGLEKKSWSLVVIVLMIASGLIMFTYKATQFNVLGFNFLLIASFASGLRWTFAQLLMQKSKLGLHNPVDMVFHVQPWMFLSLLPFTIMFEGFQCFDYILSLPPEQLAPTVLKVSVGATIAFAMEISEFLVVTYTSSLTLSIAGIFKGLPTLTGYMVHHASPVRVGGLHMHLRISTLAYAGFLAMFSFTVCEQSEMCILVLAVEVSGDQLSLINVAGLSLCLFGIIGHMVHKVLVIRAMAGSVKALDTDDFDAISRTRSPKVGEHSEPLLLEQDHKWASEESDIDANDVIYEVMQRRDGR